MSDRPELSDILDELGLTPNRSKALSCPAHQDDTPSLQLYDDHWYCFSCGATGDSYGLLALYAGRPVEEILRERGNGRPALRKATIGLRRTDVKHAVWAKYRDMHNWFWDELKAIHTVDWKLLQSVEYWSDVWRELVEQLRGDGMWGDEPQLTPYGQERVLDQFRSELVDGLRWEEERA